MKLYNLFELQAKSPKEAKKIKGASNKENKDGHQDINIRDPRLKRRIQKAGAYTGYAETDLEAVVKQWSREQRHDQEQIDDLKDREDALEKNVKRLKQREDELEKDLDKETQKRKTKIEQLHAQFDNDIAEIESKTNVLIDQEKQYSKKIDDLYQTKTEYEKRFTDLQALDDEINNIRKSGDELDALTHVARDRVRKLNNDQHNLEDFLGQAEEDYYNSHEIINQYMDDLQATLMTANSIQDELYTKKDEILARTSNDEMDSTNEPSERDDPSSPFTDVHKHDIKDFINKEPEQRTADYNHTGDNPSNRQGRNPQTGEPMDIATGRKKRSTDKKTQYESKIMEADTPLKDRADFLAKSKELFNLQATWAELLGRDKVSEEDYNDMMEFVQKRILRLRNEAIKKGIISESKSR